MGLGLPRAGALRRLGPERVRDPARSLKDPQEGNGTVVVLDIHAGPPFADPALRHVVVPAGAPRHVTFAADLI